MSSLPFRAALALVCISLAPALPAAEAAAGSPETLRVDYVHFGNASEESFAEVLRVNLQGPYFLTQAVARWMIGQQKAAAGWTGSTGNRRRRAQFPKHPPPLLPADCRRDSAPDFF